MKFEDLVKSRKSKRWFTDKDIDKEKMRKILEIAGNAPSFKNHQPWQVAVVGRNKMKELAVIFAEEQKKGNHEKPFPWPEVWPSPHDKIIEETYRNHRRVLPDDPYSWWFYNASVSIFIHIHRDLNEWSVLDCGSFMQTLLLAAKQEGIDSVPQAKLANFNTSIAGALNLPPERKIIVGVSLGYADLNHQNNQNLTKRESLDNWTSWFTE